MARKKSQNMQRKNDVKHSQTRLMETLVEQNIISVAALAWAGYQEEGRGVVLVPFDPERLDAQYHGENGDTWEDMKIVDTLPEVVDMVREYNPKTELVALLVTEKEANAYVFTGMPLPPPLAYEKVMAEGS